jgi:hypothetical protein
MSDLGQVGLIEQAHLQSATGDAVVALRDEENLSLAQLGGACPIGISAPGSMSLMRAIRRGGAGQHFLAGNRAEAPGSRPECAGRGRGRCRNSAPGGRRGCARVREHRHGPSRCRRIRPLALLDWEELETFNALHEIRHITMPQLIADWQQSAYGAASFRSYLSSRYGGQNIGRSAERPRTCPGGHLPAQR